MCPKLRFFFYIYNFLTRGVCIKPEKDAVEQKHTFKLTHKAVMNKTEIFKLKKLSKLKAIIVDLLKDLNYI